MTKYPIPGRVRLFPCVISDYNLIILIIGFNYLIYNIKNLGGTVITYQQRQLTIKSNKINKNIRHSSKNSNKYYQSP